MEQETEFPQSQMFTSQKFRGSGGTKHHRGRTPSDCRTYEIGHLTERHHQIKRMALMGITPVKIAEALGCTKQTVTTVLNSAMVRKELALARASLDLEAYDVAKEIQRLHPKSMQILEDILDDEDAPKALKMKVAMDNLSRGGFSPVVRGSLTVNHAFSTDEIEQIKRDALEAGARLGHIVDAEFTELTELTEPEDRPASRPSHHASASADDASDDELIGADHEIKELDESDDGMSISNSPPAGPDGLQHQPVRNGEEEFKDGGSGI